MAENRTEPLDSSTVNNDSSTINPDSKTVPQPDKDIEELDKLLRNQVITIGTDAHPQVGTMWAMDSDRIAIMIITKLRTLGWEKRGGEAIGDLTKAERSVWDGIIKDLGAGYNTTNIASVKRRTVVLKVDKILKSVRPPSEIRAIKRDAVERVFEEIEKYIKDFGEPRSKGYNWDFISTTGYHALKSELLGEQGK
jgi:hypothetical protein